MTPNNASTKKPRTWLKQLLWISAVTALGLVLVLSFFAEFDALTIGLYQWVTETWVLLSSIRLGLIALIAIYWARIIHWLARWARLTPENTDYLIGRRWLYITALLLIEGLGFHYMLTRLG